MHGPLTLSMKELDRLDVITRIAGRRLTRRRAAALLRISERQVRRLYRAFVQDGAAGLVSRRRGRPSARRLPAATRSEEHTSELQSQSNLVCRLLLEKKKKKKEHNNLRRDTITNIVHWHDRR